MYFMITIPVTIPQCLISGITWGYMASSGALEGVGADVACRN